jgi:hypothetical protein
MQHCAAPAALVSRSLLVARQVLTSRPKGAEEPLRECVVTLKHVLLNIVVPGCGLAKGVSGPTKKSVNSFASALQVRQRSFPKVCSW